MARFLTLVVETTPSPLSPDLYENYFSTSYLPRNDVSEAGMKSATATYRRQFAEYLPTNRRAPILEIGCGVGGFLNCCRELGYSDVHGIDISADQVEFCRSSGFPNVEHADALTYLRSENHQYHVVVMSDVLEHIERGEVLPTLSAVLESLEPGGRLILRVPNLSNPWNLRTRYVDFTHEVGFTTESIAQVLRMSGFEVTVVRGLFTPHRRWLARLIFDRLLWSALRLVHRHTLHLKNEPARGKNLLAVGVKPLG